MAKVNINGAAKCEVSSPLLARTILGALFLYHGLVPKILFLSPLEVQMIQAHGLGLPAERVAAAAGVAEVLLGMALLLWRRARWPLQLALLSLLLLLVDVAIVTPELLVGAFNPVTTNMAAIGLCLIALRDQPQIAE